MATVTAELMMIYSLPALCWALYLIVTILRPSRYQVIVCLFCFFETGSHYVAQAGLKFTIFLPLECCNYGGVYATTLS
jgi:hypothetical protein